MSTFQELQASLTNAKFKRAVVQHLIEYIDSNFRPIAGGEPKNKLMTDEKVSVPPSIFESVVAEVLLQVDGELESVMTGILNSSISGTVATPVENPGKKNKKSTPKEEAKT
jgi:hypothetical protein